MEDLFREVDFSGVRSLGFGKGLMLENPGFFDVSKQSAKEIICVLNKVYSLPPLPSPFPHSS